MRFPRLWKNQIRLAAHLLLALPLAACAYRQATLFPPTPTEKPIQDVYALVLLFDGARPRDVDRLVAAGRLPNIERLFYRDGARYSRAMAVIPSASGPSHQSFLSGLFPGHHGIPSLDWFSRPMLKHIDYLKPTEIALTNTYMFNFKQVERDRIVTDQPHLIYHDLHGHPTAAIFESNSSGVTQLYPKHLPLITAFHGKMEQFYEQFDLAAMRDALKVYRDNPADRIPRFGFVSFYGMDMVSHYDGLDGARLEDLYLQYDRFLGEMETVLKDRDIWEKTQLVVLSDHGQHSLSKVTDLKKILRDLGLRFNLSKPESSEVMFGDHGLAFSNLYFKMGDDWQRRPSYADLRNYPTRSGNSLDLIAKFLEQPDIEFVVAPEGPWRLHIHRAGEHAVIERSLQNGIMRYAYRPDPGSDPLRYLAVPQIAAWRGSFQDAETWLQATVDQTFPDTVVLLSSLFDDYRVGDLVLLTVKDSQFKEKRFAGHGSIYDEDMNTVLMFHGPGVQPGVYRQARSVDLYPTLLALFGIAPDAPIDGVARLDPWKMANPAPAVAQSKGESRDAFRERLRAKLAEPGLPKSERDKAKQLLYSLDSFESDRSRYAMPQATPADRGVARREK